MNAQVPTSILKIAREAAGLSQTDLAQKLKVSPSVVSRLESTEYADGQMARRYLIAVATDFASEVVNFYEEKWRFTERPPFLHPARDALRAAEDALRVLDEFEGSQQFDEILRDPLSKLRNRIVNETDFVRHMEHGLAFIGDIGVGKTTALSFVMNLVTSDKAGKSQSVFPTGSGRTTVCEVAIKIAPAFGIAVDSLDEEEIRRLVSDLVVGLKTGKTGLPTELARVIRNMADLRETTTRPKDGSGKPKLVDRMRELIDAYEDTDRVIAEVISRMKLDSRTEAQMILSDHTDRSIDWLTTNISKINFGQHPGFSVPHRITVLLPLKALRETPYLLSVIDTKGVEGTTQRRDLKAQIDDPRTVTILCTKFSDAPGGTAISIIKELIDSGSDALDLERICLLVLPRGDEALKIVNGSGSNPDSAEEGYAIREAQIGQQFATEGLPVLRVNFYNVETDKPEEVWNWLKSGIERLRENKTVRIKRLVGAAHDLVTNSDVAKTRQARRTIADTIRGVVERFRILRPTVRPAHQNLVAEAKKTHQSSIAASVNRRGEWENFQATHILGIGVRVDANLRTRETFVRIDEQIEGLKSKYPHLLDVHQFLDSIKDDVAACRQEFLNKAALTGRVSFAPLLREAGDLWEACWKLYGTGSGYRVNVSDVFLEYFEGNTKALETAAKVEASLAEIWIDVVIDPLEKAASLEEPEGSLSLVAQ
jgi:transcriptional regulator with XRE-family HTH domain